MRNVTTYLFLLIISIYSSSVFAQKTITGRVTDAEDGKALPGATIKASEIRGTNTDKDGNFTLKNIPDNITSWTFPTSVTNQSKRKFRRKHSTSNSAKALTRPTR
jgi:hypothetical protein